MNSSHFSHPRLTKGARAAVVAVALSLGAAACGSSVGTDTSESPENAEGPFKVGLIAPATGIAAASGKDMLDGWNFYWKKNGSSVAGREVVTEVQDGAGDVATALNKSRLLVQQEEIELLVGPLFGNVGDAVYDYLSTEGVPAFAPIVASDDLTQRRPLDGIMRVGGWSASQATHPLGDWAYKQGHRTAVMLCTDYNIGHEGCAGFARTFTDAGGEIIDVLYTPRATTDYSTYMAQIQAKDPDVIMSIQTGADAVRSITSYASFGLKGKIPMIGGITTLDQSVLRGAGEAALGLVSASHFAEGRDAENVQEFVEEYTAEYGVIPSYYSAGMYVAAETLAKALEATDGQLTRENLPDVVADVVLEETPFGPQEIDDYGNPIQNIYIREVVAGPGGQPWNVVKETYEDVSQFWNYDPKEFLEQPVYSKTNMGF